jgi:hypothetical protein
MWTFFIWIKKFALFIHWTYLAALRTMNCPVQLISAYLIHRQKLRASSSLFLDTVACTVDVFVPGKYRSNLEDFSAKSIDWNNFFKEEAWISGTKIWNLQIITRYNLYTMENLLLLFGKICTFNFKKLQSSWNHLWLNPLYTCSVL